jgi:hypothetical protein
VTDSRDAVLFWASPLQQASPIIAALRELAHTACLHTPGPKLVTLAAHRLHTCQPMPRPSLTFGFAWPASAGVAPNQPIQTSGEIVGQWLEAVQQPADGIATVQDAYVARCASVWLSSARP